jgi:hypothetical protein
MRFDQAIRTVFLKYAEGCRRTGIHSLLTVEESMEAGAAPARVG